ncbi:phytoene desaturase family protein [Pseudalkalibacillus caeni]|uniref:4,4'-diaponeurosporene oxygenase n=1 Tax=Exobacillus caeni TaxID=2574798 RepID=A0A5R9EY80_9BACL|nr:phytoene desaturase family protein [Pseudalkalibacillus caeni]TLS36077.1 phytoene desaturase [Pseudalkalibacillus caeni]
MTKKVAIIGGGLGGLSTAISMASEGHSVTVFEKNERAGGKLNIRTGKGYSFDTGPSILTMPWVLEQLFGRAGRNIHDYLTIQRIEPQWRTFFEDGTTIDVTSDIPSMRHQLKSLSPEDASSFFDYLAYCSKMYDLNMKSFYKKSLSGLNDLRSMHSFKELMAMDPMRTMDQATKKHFKDERLQQLFNFFIMYIGSSPYHAPAVLSQLAHVQFGLGIYYVKGGMYKIAEAMLQLCDELGVEVKTNQEVTEIVTEGSDATALKFQDGTVVEADLFVSNLEAIPAYKKLLNNHPASEKTTESLKKYEPTVSGLVMLLGVDKKYDQLAHHNFFFSKDPEKEFREIFDEGKPAVDPTVYIGVSSKSDPDQAPEGKENLFILTHVPPLKDGESWESYREQYRNLVLNKLERMGLDDIRDHVEFDYEFIPDDIERLYGANGGSIYGVNTDRKKNGGFKIPARSSLLSNLYFAGGSTHPGGGVPMVTLSGQLTSDLIMDDLKVKGQKIG